MAESPVVETAAAQTFDAATYSSLGTPREAVTLPQDLFDGTVNAPVMHKAVTAYLANQRQGNASTKIRKFVAGGNQKPWKQKGTGRARQGSIRAPQWVGGGTVFGPTPRSYAQYVPRQVRALARKSALNARAREGAVKVIDAFDYERPQTSRLHALMERLGLGERKVLILTDGLKPNVFLSGRNIPTVHVMPYADVSTYHVLWSDTVLIESSALGTPLEPLTETAPAAKERPVRARQVTPRPTAKREAAAATETKHHAKKAAAPKRSAKKASTKKATAHKAAAKKSGGHATAKRKAVAKKSAPKKKKGK